MKPTDTDLFKVMKYAVQIGIFPKYAHEEVYIENYEKLSKLLEFIFKYVKVENEANNAAHRID